MERKFEKISLKQFQKDINPDEKKYQDYSLPRRATKNSCGYDFFAIEEITLHPGEIKKIPTGYKASFPDDEMLLLVIRSSMGFKYNVRMCNQIGIIDSDYYNNPTNEGHMWVALQNEGNQDYKIEQGTAYCQGIFTKYLTCNDQVETKRTSGIGSTNKENDNNDK